MGTIPVLKPREVTRLLLALGFQEVRQRGSHRQYRHSDGRGTTVPFHAGREFLPPSFGKLPATSGWTWKNFWQTGDNDCRRPCVRFSIDVPQDEAGPEMIRTRQVGILIFDDVEVLDFAGPFEVFSVTRTGDRASANDSKAFDVALIGLAAEGVCTAGGMRVVPRWSLVDCPHVDVLVVPGGWGTRRLLDHTGLRTWLQQRATSVELLTSVCTGSLLLAGAGLLDGRRATTHWQALDTLEKLRPAVSVVRDQHVVEEGSIFTSAGISAGIDMALRVVGRLHGEVVARATARHMEYPYPESNVRRS